MSTSVVVGAPACRREWIFPTYITYVQRALSHAGVSADFVFAVATWDSETREVIRGCKPTAEILDIKEPQRSDQRVWNIERYVHMAELRNRLLETVRDIGPDFYWSIDTDILPAEDALSHMLYDNEARDKPFDAVGGKAYMDPPPGRCPSYSFLDGDGLTHRIDQDYGFFQVDVVMATKVLSPAAYDIDYAAHPMGEDIGFSKACKEAGLRLGWNSQALHRHVMARELLRGIDPRLGW